MILPLNQSEYKTQSKTGQIDLINNIKFIQNY